MNDIEEARSKKTAAGVCGILLGGLGIHKFILGMTGPGLIMLLSSILGVFLCFVPTVVMWVIGLAEGIVYLSQSDEQFLQNYLVQKKAWF